MGVNQNTWVLASGLMAVGIGPVGHGWPHDSEPELAPLARVERLVAGAPGVRFRDGPILRQRIERGVENPTIDVLDRLATVLEISIGDLLVPIVDEKPPEGLRKGRKPKER